MQPVTLDDGKELSPSESHATCEATKDESYYFHFVTFEVKGKPGVVLKMFLTLILFQVENRLFRVPSYQFFGESLEFSAKYNLSAYDCDKDSDPIKLEMVTQEDFRCLLRVLYPL